MTSRGRDQAAPGRGLPRHGWLGLGLVALAWPANWLLPGLRTAWFFFPLWLGYSLAVDGINVRRTGTSLLTRSPRMYAGLFLISAPLWWLFEAMNLRTANWIYLGREQFGDLEYAARASLAFSTVVPAVLGTAEWAASLSIVRWFSRGPRIAPTRRTIVGFFCTGLLMLTVLLIWPRYGFPFVWLSIYFLVEPVNVWLGHRSLFEWTRERDWRPVGALWIGVLVCGFFWEMWNLYSYPKWIYDVPLLDLGHVFEMPLLGYFGYLPFSLELVAVVHLVLGLAGYRRTDYVYAGLAGGR